MILGKTFRVFAATLVASSISFAGEGAGTNEPPNTPTDAANVAALFVGQQELEPQDVTLPDGTHAIQRTEILSATATTPGQLASLIKLGAQTLEEGRAEGGTIVPFVINPDAESRKAIAEIISDKKHSADAPATEVRLPKNWNAWFKYYGEDFRALKTSGYQIDGHNRTLTIARITLNFGSPILIATLLKGIPWWAALPYCAALSDLSGLISAVPTLLPWNRPFPRDPKKIVDTKSKLQSTIQWGTKGVTWWAVEGLFLEAARRMMVVSTQLAIAMGAHPQLDIQTHLSLWLTTATIAAFSQGLYDLANSKLLEIQMIKLEPLKKISSERYFAAETRIKNIFYNIGFAASVVEVSLAAGRMINWTPANIGFWIYAAGGAMLTAHVFGWTTKIANYFNFKITKLDEMIALEPVKTPERSRTFAEEIAEKCDYNLASFGRRLKK